MTDKQWKFDSKKGGNKKRRRPSNMKHMTKKQRKIYRKKAKKICPDCNGRGGEYKQAGFAGIRWHPCKTCNGTGRREDVN